MASRQHESTVLDNTSHHSHLKFSRICTDLPSRGKLKGLSPRQRYCHRWSQRETVDHVFS